MARLSRALAAALLSCGLFSAAAQPLLAASRPPKLQYEITTLPNGLTVVLSEDHSTPIVHVSVTYHVGSKNERAGRTGFAHLFEHLMFKGSKNVQPEAHTSMLASIGGQSNAYTTDDETVFWETVPAQYLPLSLWLEADRMATLRIDKDTFANERDVVKEERRMRVDTNPDGKLYENFIATAYMAHPYHHPTIGWESDLDHLSVADLEDFYHRYYTPDQLTIAVVGDVQAAQVIALVDKYFGDWRVKAPPRPAVTLEPVQSGPRRVTVRYEAQPHLIMGFHIPTAPDPDHIHAYAVAQLLGAGTTSRLYKALVEKKKIASDLETAEDEPGERYGSLFVISVSPRFPHSSAEVERAVLEEIERVKTQPIESWEMEKLRAAVDVGILSNLQTNAGMATTLSYDQSIFGDWHYLLTFQRRIKEMTAADLQQMAQKYLKTDNMTVATLEPLKPAGAKR